MEEITREIIEIIAPEHDRTSCSDENRCNGLASAEAAGRTAPRCPRCALLDILEDEGGRVPDNFELEITAHLRKTHGDCPSCGRLR